MINSLKDRYKRTFLLYLLLLLVFMGIADALIISSQRIQLYEGARNDLQNQMHLIDISVREPLLRQNYSEVEQFLLAWAREHSDIVEVEAVMPSGFVLVGHVREKPAAKTYSIERKVNYFSRDLITIRVLKDFAPVDKILNSLRIQHVVESIILTALFGIVLWFTMKKFAITPLEAEIKRRIFVEEMIRDAKNNLEVRVEERTNELKTINEQLNIEIAEREKVGTALRESEQLYADLFNGMVEGFALHEIICDEKGKPADYRFLKVNPAFEKLTGLRAADIIGRTVLDVLPGTEKHWIDTYGRVALTGEPVHFENYSGAINMYFKVTAYSPRQKQFVAIFEDITEQKIAVQEQERLSRELEVKNKELQQIVYTVSHDLRAPLINMRGYSRMLVDYLNDVVSAFTGGAAAPEVREETVSILDKDIPEAVSYIDASISKMDTLLSSMLVFSRTASIELQKKAVDMNEVMREVLKVADFQIKAAGARFEVSELPSCYGDEQQINQIFSNLIGNAIKFLSPERPGVISISGRKEDGQAVYCVEDNGIGIPLAEQERIFDIFYRMHNEEQQGQGLGLAIVRKIVERHGGRIWVESEFGKGSRFYVQLPGIKA